MKMEILVHYMRFFPALTRGAYLLTAQSCATIERGFNCGLLEVLYNVPGVVMIKMTAPVMV